MTITVTDLFCGAGGSSSGMVRVPGVEIRMAANHWNLAIESHQTNHPDTDHDSADLSQVEPSRYPRTDILWASPECTNHSVAKGVARQRAVQDALPGMSEKRLPDDAAVRSRATMWDVPRFAEYHRYKAIIIENVVEAHRWILFPAWLNAMEALGYMHEIVWLNSMHAHALGMPAPQSRDRMYVIFWLAGNRAPDLEKWTRPHALCQTHGVVQAVQTFKKKEKWGRYRAQYVYRCGQCAEIVEPSWLPAEAVIDWSIPGQRIGDRKRPLADKTRKRIEAGLKKYGQVGLVTDIIHGQGNARPMSEPMGVQTTAQTKSIAVPPIMIPVEGRDGKEAQSAVDPLRTQTTRNETGVLISMRGVNAPKSTADVIDTVAANGNHHALLMRNNGSKGDGGEMVTPVTEPARTLTTAGHQSLLVPYYGTGTPAPVQEPHRTLPTNDRYSLVDMEDAVDDCLFRMLEPHEIKLGMAFDRDYIILGNKREQVKQSGNAVTPPAARDLVAAVAESLGHEIETAELGDLMAGFEDSHISTRAEIFAGDWGPWWNEYEARREAAA